MATTIGIKIDININLKYHFGTFDRSNNSAISETTKILVKIGTIIAVISVAKYGFEIHKRQ